MKTNLRLPFIFAGALVFAGNLSAQTTFNYTGSVQTYTVPAGIVSINIVASGAQGGGYVSGGGLGATMDGDYSVTPGQTLYVVVGQQGLLQVGGNYQNSSGGGGGSFVYTASNTLLVAAGGGGGMCNYTGSPALHAGAHGNITTTGGANTYGQYLGGTGGNGGAAGLWSSTPCAGGGAGWLSAGGGPYGGMNAAGSWAGGSPFCGGGGGGCGGYGGYGGGGGGGNHYGGGGGGGGYSGGGGATDPDHGGGGGSYSIGTNQSNVGGNRTGNGIVIITPNCAPTILTPDNNSLPAVNAECSANPAAPTATNDCGQTVTGTPSVSLPITTFGTTVITWTYNDGVSTVTQNQSVTVGDNTPPVPDLNGLPDLLDMCATNNVVPPTATDNCSGTITGTTTTTFPVTAAGTTVITWTFDDGNGNTSTQTQNVVNPTIDVTVTQNGGTLTAAQSAATYSWLDCDNGFSPLSEYNQSFTATAITGNYAVEVTVGSCVDTSACYLVDYTGIDEQLLSELMVYPNPSADGNFTVHSAAAITQVRMYDILGRELPCVFNANNGTIRTGVKEAGTYFIHLYSSAGSAIREVQIQ